VADVSLLFNILARDNTGPAFKSASKAAMAAGGLAASAMAAGMAGAFSSEDALAKLKAQAGDAMWAGAAGQAAGKLYENAYGESMADTAAAVRATFSGGLLKDDATPAQIEALTGKAMSLAQTFDQDVGPLAAAAGQMIKTGMAKNADEAFDIITRGFQTGADKAEDFLDTLNEYGSQFRKLGIDGETATGLISQGLKAGARDGDIVADAMKEFSIRAIDGSKAAAAGYEALGLSAKKMTAQIAGGGKGASAGLQTVLDRLRAIKDPVERSAAAVQLFGTQAEDLGDALYALDPSKAVAGLGKVAGAAGEVDKTMGGTASAAVTAFTRQVQGELTRAMAGAIPYITGAANALKPFMPLVVPLVAVLGGFAAAVLAVNTASRVWAATQAALVTVTRAWMIAQRLLNGTLLANPIGLVVVAVGLLVAGFVLAYKKSETFRTVVNAVFDGVRTVIVSALGAVATRVLAAIGAIVHGAAKLGGWIPLVGRKLKAIDRAFSAFRDDVNAELNAITSRTLSINSRMPAPATIPARASGGPVTRGPVLVGEEGPEIVTTGSAAPPPPTDWAPRPDGGRRRGRNSTLTIEQLGGHDVLARLIRDTVQLELV
jgi:phage-related minor tail protein